MQFKDGKVVKATAAKTRSSCELLKTDKGAPYVESSPSAPKLRDTAVTKNILFDERSAGRSTWLGQGLSESGARTIRHPLGYGLRPPQRREVRVDGTLFSGGKS